MPGILAGTWYPEDPNNLRMSVESYLMKGARVSGDLEPKSVLHTGRVSASGAPSAGVSDAGRLRGLILPHAGHKYSGLTCAAGAAAVRSREIRKLILIGPAHRAFVAGAALSCDAF